MRVSTIRWSLTGPASRCFSFRCFSFFLFAVSVLFLGILVALSVDFGTIIYPVLVVESDAFAGPWQ